MNWLQWSNPLEKIKFAEEVCHQALMGQVQAVPDLPGRDVAVLPIRELPAKVGFSSPTGQARLLHDLASIELQAMELGVRTLWEFPEAPKAFREELVRVTLEEAQHLEGCLIGMEELGHQWGDWPVHIGLWQANDRSDSLLDRVLIVHRYLEGSGLDAGQTLLRRLNGVMNPKARRPVEVIVRDELEHVRFGSRWYREICVREKIDPDKDFGPRLLRLFHRIPRRLEPIDRSLREAAGFSTTEIEILEQIQLSWRSGRLRIHPG